MDVSGREIYSTTRVMEIEQHQTLNLKPETLNFKQETLNFKHETLNIKLETLNIKEGIYFLEIKTSTKSYVTKFVKR